MGMTKQDFENENIAAKQAMIAAAGDLIAKQVALAAATTVVAADQTDVEARAKVIDVAQADLDASKASNDAVVQSSTDVLMRTPFFAYASGTVERVTPNDQGLIDVSVIGVDAGNKPQRIHYGGLRVVRVDMGAASKISVDDVIGWR